VDDLLPEYDAAERHRTVVRAPRALVWVALRSLDLRRSIVVRTLFMLRGMNLRSRGGDRRVAMEDPAALGFTILVERPEEEIALGIVGKFWRPAGPIRPVDAGAFVAFDEPGWAKAVWSFSLGESPGGIVVTTETRVRCTDAASRRAFLRYWRVIRPFSGLVRREALRLVRRSAERATVACL
jgi:hypothetical protein